MSRNNTSISRHVQNIVCEHVFFFGKIFKLKKFQHGVNVLKYRTFYQSVKSRIALFERNVLYACLQWAHGKCTKHRTTLLGVFRTQSNQVIKENAYATVVQNTAPDLSFVCVWGEGE
jgi:hypothetical protein